MMNPKNFKNDSTMGSQNINNKTKQIKGGFKMKPTRFLIVALVLMGLVATASAITEQGTIIQNQAIGNYNDANGNPMTQVNSLIVSTTVSQVAGIGLGLDQAESIQSMTSYLYPVTIDNSGNGDDFFNLVATGAVVPTGDTYTIEVYSDEDGAAGVIDGTDAIVSATSTLTYTDTYKLLVKVTDVNGGDPGDQHTVTLIATSDFNSTVKDTILLVTTVQAAAVNGTTDIIDNPNPEAGETITFKSCFTNSGTVTAYNPVYRTTMPSNTTLDVNSVSIDGGNNFLTIATSAPWGDSHFRNDTLELFLSDLEGSAMICVQFDAVLDANLTPIDVVVFDSGNPSFTYENISGSPYPVENPAPTGDFDGTIEVEQTYGVILADGGGSYAFTGDPGDTLIFDFSVTNNGNGDDSFTLSDTSDFVTWVFYLDDGDGILSAAEKAAGAIIVTGTLNASETVNYIAIGTIPVGSADGANDASILIAATSVNAPTTTSDTGSASALVTAPVLSLVKSVTHGGSTYYNGDANSAAPGDTLTYTILVVNSGSGVATTVVVSDTWGASNLNDVTYVAESMTIDGVGVDDAANSDGGTKTGSSVLFEFASISAANAGDTDQRILTFKVAIN